MLLQAEVVAALVSCSTMAGLLLSDLALDHTCQRCGTMPALTLLPQNRAGIRLKEMRIYLADRFDGD